jgi:hypothetical protein
LAAFRSAYAVLLIPQKSGGGPLTLPVTFGLRCGYATLRIRCHYPLGDAGLLGAKGMP